MENFPASEFMTEFEIAEFDNEMYENNIRRLRMLRQAREAEEAEINRQEGERFLIQAAAEAEVEREETQAVITDILNTIFAQDFYANTLSHRYMRVAPLHTSSSSSQSSLIISDDSDYHDDYEASDESGDKEGSGLLQNNGNTHMTEQNHINSYSHLYNDNQNQSHQENEIQDNNTDQKEKSHNQSIPFPNTDSENEYLMNVEAEKTIVLTSSNNTSVTNSEETFYSPESSIPSNSSTSPEQHITPSNKSKEQEGNPLINSVKFLPIRQGEIAFLRKINSIAKKPKDKPIYIISSVRPSFACSTNQDYFVCHTCHSLKRHINYKDKEWKKDHNEYPFIRNIASIWKHLYYSHCNMELKDNSLMDKEVRKYVLSYYNNKGFKNPIRKFLQQNTSITKSLSTSCLRTAWKSNQTEISKEIVNTYYFQENCCGHRRMFFTEGIAYQHDLAISMYCTCNAKKFPKERQKKYYKIQQVQFGNQGMENDINNDHTFFNRESMSILGVNSIHQIHPTFIVPYKINMKLPSKLPKNRIGKLTRSITNNKLKIQQEKQDSSINISSIPDKDNPINSLRRPPTLFTTIEAETPRQAIRAAATSAARLGVATAKLLNIKKKTTPPSDS